MKVSKILLASMLAAAGASMAFAAPTYIKVTGSTAFRKANIFAICNSLNSPKAAFVGTAAADLSGQARAVIRGTLKTGTHQDVVYQVGLGGSVGGIAGIDANQGSVPGASFNGASTWMKDDSVGGGNTLTAVTIGTNSITGANFIASPAFEAWSQPKVAFSDSLASSTPFTSNPNVTEVTVGPVGVIDFYWVKGAKHTDVTTAQYNSLTNITQQQAAALQKAGILPLSLFTGVAADSAVDVVCVGRNSDSGTRLAAEAEPQLGFQAITPNLYRSLGAAVGLDNAWTGFPEVGYDSGAKVAADLRVVFNAGVKDENNKPFILVGYVGKSDKNTAIAGSVAAVLAYNGVTPSDAGINNGQYSFWTFQHTYHTYTNPTDVAVIAIEAQAAQVLATDFAQSGISIGSMAVSRLFEGAPIN